MLLAVNFAIGILDVRDGQRSPQPSMLKSLESSQQQWGVYAQGRGDILDLQRSNWLELGEGAGVKAKGQFK